MNFVGIDYSMSCPAMTILPETSDSFNHAKVYFLTNVKSHAGVFFGGNVIGAYHDDYCCEQERFNNIGKYFLTNIPNDATILIEGYSFGSSAGRVFNIAENTGHLKYLLWNANKKFDVVSPSEVKKIASGKGNADKQKMYEAFKEQSGLDLMKMLAPNRKLGSPITDIIDSFYIAKLCRSRYAAGINNK